MGFFRRFASVFFVFLPTTRLENFKRCFSDKIFVILKQNLKLFCIIRYYTEVFRTLYRSF